MISIQKLDKNILAQYLDQLLILDESSFGSQCWGKENFLSELPRKFELSNISILDDKVIGYLVAYSPAPSTIHISRILSNAAGIGSALIIQLLSRLEEPNDYNIVTLEFDVALKVKGFYEKFGFEEMEIEDLEAYVKTMKKKSSELYLKVPKTRIVMYTNRSRVKSI